MIRLSVRHSPVKIFLARRGSRVRGLVSVHAAQDGTRAWPALALCMFALEKQLHQRVHSARLDIGAAQPAGNGFRGDARLFSELSLRHAKRLNSLPNLFRREQLQPLPQTLRDLPFVAASKKTSPQESHLLTRSSGIENLIKRPSCLTAASYSITAGRTSLRPHSGAAMRKRPLGNGNVLGHIFIFRRCECSLS